MTIDGYFGDVVCPAVERAIPDVAAEMAVVVRGSHAFGTADALSDLDAVIWLEDALWQKQGGQLQLLLVHEVPGFGSPEVQRGSGHPAIVVWPLSWLGAKREFLKPGSNLPWDRVSVEDLFELQASLILRDPHSMFRRLRTATSPCTFPQRLWDKRLIEALRSAAEGLFEYRQAVKRDRRVEAQVISGKLIEDLLHIGFLVDRAYWPWRTHLWWAFERLPTAPHAALADLAAAASETNDAARLDRLDAAFQRYCRLIDEERRLTTLDLRADDLRVELVWAERLQAWRDPEWRDRITKFKDGAQAAGRDESDFWVWSLWGWANRGMDQGVVE